MPWEKPLCCSLGTRSGRGGGDWRDLKSSGHGLCEHITQVLWTWQLIYTILAPIKCEKHNIYHKSNKQPPFFCSRLWQLPFAPSRKDGTQKHKPLSPMHKNKHNSKEKTLCSLDLGWIYPLCHCQRQATCATGCWDWDIPPHFGTGSCKQTPTAHPRAEEEEALTNGSETSTSWSLSSACPSLQRPEQQLWAVAAPGRRRPAAHCAEMCLCLRIKPWRRNKPHVMVRIAVNFW